MLKSFKHENKIEIVKAVFELTRLGLKVAKDIVDTAPQPVLKNVSRLQAETAKRKLEAAGAIVEIIEG